jgi:SOS-response transcriptional repressor LexA
MITKRQLELLSYINLIFNTRGEIPTYEEMKKMMKVKSKSTAIEALKGLVK